MATKHPYISSNGALVQVLDYLRKSFPSTFNSETLKKLNLAPGNESYALNILRFLGFINEKGARTDLAQTVFTLHADKEFQAELSKAVQSVYSDLFSLHQDATWALTDEKLIPYFRQADKTTELVGKRQASTFRTLSGYSGHESIEMTAKPKAGKKTGGIKSPKPAKSQDQKLNVDPFQGNGNSHQKDIGLTVRIEINLPTTDDQQTYDKIFKSIRENFLNV